MDPSFLSCLESFETFHQDSQPPPQGCFSFEKEN